MEWLLWYWLCAQLAYWIFVFVGISRFDRRRDQPDAKAPLLDSAFEIVIPVFNESRHLTMIAATLKEARAAGIRPIVVDDGSNDGSAVSLDRLCHRANASLLIHHENRGKAAALRTGLEAVTSPFVLLADADTLVPVRTACEVPVAPTDAAVAFTIAAIENGPLATAQATEYEYILNFEREALAGFGLVLTVPGAASLWRTEAIRAIGGFSSRTDAEDTDATISLQMAGWLVAVGPAIVANTDCPATLRSLVRQRARWIWGNLQAAYYAVAACHGDDRALRRLPAIAIASVGAFNVLGYAVATTTLLRLSVLDLGMMDFVASAMLGLATFARVLVARRLRPLGDRRLIVVLGSLPFMQLVNFAGFWLGALRMVVRRRTW